MLPIRGATCCRALRVAGRPALYFGLYYLYILFVVNPGLIYESDFATTRFPVFRYGQEFLEDFLARPGGPAEYVAALLSQFYYYPWAGALIITAVAALLCAAGATLWTISGARQAAWVPYLPAVFVAVLCGRYAHVLGLCLAIAVSALLACVYAWLPLQKDLHRTIAFVVLACVSYYVAAAGYLVFAVLCTMNEMVNRRRGLLGIRWLGLAGAVVYLLGAQVLGMRLRDVAAGPIPSPAGVHWHTQALMVALYALYPMTALAAAIKGRPGKGAAVTAEQAAAPPRAEAAVRWSVGTAVLVFASAAVAWLTLSQDFRNLLRIEWCSSHRRWAELLQAAGELPRRKYNAPVQWEVNRALYYTERLLDRMFAYPQHPRSLMPDVRPMALTDPHPVVRMRASALLFDLGRVNEAERISYEAMEMAGERPKILERVALISIAKGETEAARVLLGSLARDPVYGPRAAALLRELASDPTLAQDAQVQFLRSTRPDSDRVRGLTFEVLLEELLQRNPHNRMALEYLLADHLLNCRLDRIVADLSRLDARGGPGLPRHLEEALAICIVKTGRQPDLRGHTVSSGTLQRCAAFEAARARYGSNTVAWVNALGPEWGGTYFFYYEFQTSGEGP